MQACVEAKGIEAAKSRSADDALILLCSLILRLRTPFIDGEFIIVLLSTPILLFALLYFAGSHPDDEVDCISSCILVSPDSIVRVGNEQRGLLLILLFLLPANPVLLEEIGRIYPENGDPKWSRKDEEEK